MMMLNSVTSDEKLFIDFVETGVKTKQKYYEIICGKTFSATRTICFFFKIYVDDCRNNLKQNEILLKHESVFKGRKVFAFDKFLLFRSEKPLKYSFSQTVLSSKYKPFKFYVFLHFMLISKTLYRFHAN